jgi:hypothetical protein
LIFLEFGIANMKKGDMARTKSYSGHESAVSAIAIKSNDAHLFTTGMNDQCIIQWKVNYENKFSELDYYRIQLNVSDPFGELPSSEAFRTLQNEVLILSC